MAAGDLALVAWVDLMASPTLRLGSYMYVLIYNGARFLAKLELDNNESYLKMNLWPCGLLCVGNFLLFPRVIDKQNKNFSDFKWF